MKEFLDSLGSISWWLSVVVVGVLVHLVSTYLKSRLDSSLSRRSAKSRERAEAQKVKRQKQIESLCSRFRRANHDVSAHA